MTKRSILSQWVARASFESFILNLHHLKSPKPGLISFPPSEQSQTNRLLPPVPTLPASVQSSDIYLWLGSQRTLGSSVPPELQRISSQCHLFYNQHNRRIAADLRCLLRQGLFFRIICLRWFNCHCTWNDWHEGGLGLWKETCECRNLDIYLIELKIGHDPWMWRYLKGQFIQKLIFCHCLLTLLLFQTWQNTKEYIMMNVSLFFCP